MTVRFASPIRRLVAAIEQLVSKSVHLHLVPTFSRYEWLHDRMELLENIPSRADLSAAKSIARQAPPRSTELVVYINGWIGQSRGAPVFLSVANFIAEHKLQIRILAAGRVDSESGRQLISHPVVDFVGSLSAIDALALYYLSDVVLTYYDPAIPINRTAQSNKWGDCIRAGVPFIVNEEVEAADVYVREGISWSLPYSDSDQLGALLARLSVDRAELRTKAEVLRHAELPQDFETVTTEIFERHYILEQGPADEQP